jgi:hypothetical protein
MQIGADEQWLIGGGAGKPGGADISCSPTKLVPALLERVGSRSSTDDSRCFVTVAEGLQDWLGIVVRPSSVEAHWHLSHVACWVGRLLKPRFMIEAKQPQSHVIRMFVVECLLPLSMCVHGQTRISLLGESMVRGVVPKSDDRTR